MDLPDFEYFWNCLSFSFKFHGFSYKILEFLCKILQVLKKNCKKFPFSGCFLNFPWVFLHFPWVFFDFSWVFAQFLLEFFSGERKRKPVLIFLNNWRLTLKLDSDHTWSKSDQRLASAGTVCGGIILEFLKATGTNSELTWSARPWVSKGACTDGTGIAAWWTFPSLHHATNNTTQPLLFVITLPVVCLSAQSLTTTLAAAMTLQQLYAIKTSKYWHVIFLYE